MNILEITNQMTPRSHRDIALIRQGLKNAGLQKMPKDRGRPPNLRMITFGCSSRSEDELDSWGYDANGRPLRTILYYMKSNTERWRCIEMQRDANGILFETDGSRSGHFYLLG